MFDKRLLKNFDWPLLAITLLLCLIGILTIYSTAKTLDTPYHLKQLASLGLGLVVCVIVFSIDYHKWSRWAPFLYLGSLLLLFFLFFFSPPALGVRRWLSIGPLTFQPSEISKVATFLLLARYLSPVRGNPSLSGSDASRRSIGRTSNGINRKEKADILIPLAIVALPLFLIASQPDLGTALLFLPLGLVLVYLAGTRTKHLFLLIGFFLLASPLGWFFLHGYQKRRILSFLNPTRDPLGAGYNIIQSKIAIGSGRLLGKGFLNSTQSNFLPGHHTDFIFSSFAEEWGLLGSLFLILLYLFIIIRAIEISLHAKDRLGSLLAAGIATILASQVIINIAMATGILPATGLPLPFLSYGGSHLVMSLVSIGFLLNIRMRRFMF
ncbi:rod shape-determining protein RodA [bacterium]|nr:rod shape-determining protein RodA [bacterium]